MNKILLWIFITLLPLSYTVGQYSLPYIIHIGNKVVINEGDYIKTPPPLETDTIHVYPDSIYFLYSMNDSTIILLKDRGYVTGIFYLLFDGMHYKILNKAIDPHNIFNVNIYLHDINKDGNDEIITVWIHELEYFIRIDNINIDSIEVNNIFLSEDHDIPFLPEMYSIEEDSFKIWHISDDGMANEQLLIDYDSTSKKIKLKPLKRVPLPFINLER